MRRADSEWNVERSGEWLATYRGNIDDVRAAIEWSLTPAGDPVVSKWVADVRNRKPAGAAPAASVPKEKS